VFARRNLSRSFCSFASTAVVSTAQPAGEHTKFAYCAAAVWPQASGQY
jgi:hypothetical protein